MAPRERVVATSASPASILARRFRVGSSELLAGPGFNNPPAASGPCLPMHVPSPRRARRRRAAERGGHARRGDGFLRRKGPPWMGRWAAASPLPLRLAPSIAGAEAAAPEGLRKKEDTGGATIGRAASPAQLRPYESLPSPWARTASAGLSLAPFQTCDPART